jgi:hypothetical protein
MKLHLQNKGEAPRSSEGGDRIISGVLTRPQKRGIGAVLSIGVEKILSWNIQLVAKITCTAAQLVDFPAPGRIEDWKGGEGSQLPGRMGWYQPQLRQL